MTRRPARLRAALAATAPVGMLAGVLVGAAVLPQQAVAAPRPTPVAAAPAPTGSAPVTGIPQPCAATHPYPTGATPAQVRAQLSRTYGIALTGSAWDAPANAPLVRIVWQSLDALQCTSYLATIRASNPHFTLNAAPIRSWAWGDWGLTRPGAVTLDFGKWQQAYKAGDQGRLVRLLVHEMGHAWSKTPQAQTTYNAFTRQYAKSGRFGSYGGNANETFSEVVGYYVARCAKGNPYDAPSNKAGKFNPYYNIVRTGVFHGRQFGTAPGATQACAAPARPAPRKAATTSPKAVATPIAGPAAASGTPSAGAPLPTVAGMLEHSTAVLTPLP